MISCVVCVSFFLMTLRPPKDKRTDTRFHYTTLCRCLGNDLVATGLSNLAIQSRVHEAILALLRAASFEEFVETITTDLAVILDLDVVTIGVERARPEEHTSELQSLMRISYAVFCWKKKKDYQQ